MPARTAVQRRGSAAGLRLRVAMAVLRALTETTNLDALALWQVARCAALMSPPQFEPAYGRALDLLVALGAVRLESSADGRVCVSAPVGPRMN